MQLFNNFGQYLLSILPIINYNLYKNELKLNININKLLPILFFLKNHTNSQFKLLSDICVIDYINKKKRFEIIYNLLSIRFNTRLKIKILVSELESVESTVKLFSISNWLEREIWDMFGIFISNHPDLRRILTDYGFEGYPLRKDFPLSGYLEVYYNELEKRVVYAPLNLAQQYRFFEFTSPWKKI